MVKKVLLHICCAPCAVYPVKQLRKNGFQVKGLWYNPNIHPYQEYCRRQDSLHDYSSRTDLPVIYEDEYGLKEFIKLTNNDEEDRCPVCYRLRLQQTARAAKLKEYDAFTSTLLVSRHQRHDLIREIGEETAGKIGIDFYYEDFRPGNKQGHQSAREMGLYRQQSSP